MVGDDQPIHLEVIADDGKIGSDKAVSIGLIVTELMINAVKYAFPAAKADARVLITFSSAGDAWTLTVADNGIGRAADLSPRKNGGMGTVIVEALVKQLGATSHDFWLKNLGPRVWKALHMLVYTAYGLLLFHVLLGVVQLEQSPVWIGAIGLGFSVLIGLHLTAARMEWSRWKRQQAYALALEGYFEVGPPEDIPESRAKIVFIEGQNIAVFKHDGKVYAVSNRCLTVPL